MWLVRRASDEIRAHDQRILCVGGRRKERGEGERKGEGGGGKKGRRRGEREERKEERREGGKEGGEERGKKERRRGEREEREKERREGRGTHQGLRLSTHACGISIYAALSSSC